MHAAAARYGIHIDEEFTDNDDFDAAENLLERFISDKKYSDRNTRRAVVLE